jgi:hypothetical protein
MKQHAIFEKPAALGLAIGRLNYVIINNLSKYNTFFGYMLVCTISNHE